ncbi:hypothetical protein JEP8_039 [Escherichia phage JEP8]|uniref:C-5 cytosine-specific DNA methylase n=2 Tax=Krischvirus TaxID=1913651 RepID=A0A7S6HT61_9CAUD|nr:hypothetical protein JEP8_039 [Escherichia phage JEP8]
MKQKLIFCNFDGSGIMGLEWAKAGHKVVCFNADDADHGTYKKYNTRFEHPNITYVNTWIDLNWLERAMDLEWGKPDIIFAFPPCTNLAVSGAAHFERKKREQGPLIQVHDVRAAKITAYLGEWLGVPYMIENPVSVISSMWRKPDYMFHPWEYGGYLPEDDKHPTFPEYIAARDMYPKKTCLWTGQGFIMPEKKPLQINKGYSKQHSKLGGKGTRTKTIRSLTPRGFAKAVFEANKDL